MSLFPAAPSSRSRAAVGLSGVVAAVMLAAVAPALPASATTAGASPAPRRVAAERTVTYLAPGQVTTTPAPAPTPRVRTTPRQAGVQITGAASTWEVTYNSAFPAEAKTAFGRAVAVWSSKISSSQVIRVSADWETMDPGALGSAGPAENVESGSDLSAVALYEARTGRSFNATRPDIVASFSSTLGNRWYFGTGTPGPNQVDLSTVVLHELGHGLGFIGSDDVDPFGPNDNDPNDDEGRLGFADSAGNAYIYYPFDDFTATVQGSTVTPLESLADGSHALGAALQSNRLYWTGPQAIAANGGVRPRLYAPVPYELGSSGSHLDEDTYPPGSRDALMTPFLTAGEVIRDPGPLALAMLRDMGYGGTASTPSTGLSVSQKYVTALYQDFLGRVPSSSERDAAAGRLDRNQVSRKALSLELATSDEYLRKVVTGFYRNTLGRDPDQGGLDNWRNALRAGKPVAEVAAAFYASPEYYQRLGGNTDATWVEDLYAKLLGRTSDPAGKAGWVTQARSRGRVYVATQFYASNESLRRRVNDLYKFFLTRDADPSGLSTWPPVVRARGDLELAAFLASSQEYVARAQNRIPG